MMLGMDATTDPLDLLNRLTPEAISERMAQLDRERRSLAILLRSLRARDRRVSAGSRERVVESAPAA